MNLQFLWYKMSNKREKNVVELLYHNILQQIRCQCAKDLWLLPFTVKHYKISANKGTNISTFSPVEKNVQNSAISLESTSSKTW